MFKILLNKICNGELQHSVPVWVLQVTSLGKLFYILLYNHKTSDLMASLVVILQSPCYCFWYISQGPRKLKEEK